MGLIILIGVVHEFRAMLAHDAAGMTETMEMDAEGGFEMADIDDNMMGGEQMSMGNDEFTSVSHMAVVPTAAALDSSDESGLSDLGTSSNLASLNNPVFQSMNSMNDGSSGGGFA